MDDCATRGASDDGDKSQLSCDLRRRSMKVNRALAELFYEAMEQIPLPDIQKKLEFARKISEAAGFQNNGVYFTGLEPLRRNRYF